MGDKSKIEWLDGGASWNPITGCTPISEGCLNCYAKTMAETRLRGMFGYDQEDPFKVTLHEDKLNQPLEWKRPRKIFVCSMGDLFHNDVPTEWINKVFRVIQIAKQHTFIVLTKRPVRMQQYIKSVNKCRACPENDVPFPNLWLGVTAENQHTADERIPILLDTPAAKRFVSVEPMLEAMNIFNYIHSRTTIHMSVSVEGALRNKSFSSFTFQDGRPMTRAEAKRQIEELQAQGVKCIGSDKCDNFDPVEGCKGHKTMALDWVICGAETGPNTRPMSLEWARDLRDQCAEASVPFFFKKAGPNGTPIPDDLIIREYPE